MATTAFTWEGREDLLERYLYHCRIWNQGFKDFRIFCIHNDYSDGEMIANLHRDPNFYPEIPEAVTFGRIDKEFTEARNACLAAGVDILLCLREASTICDAQNPQNTADYDKVIAREIRDEKKRRRW